ncbi:hypothetical protein KAX02_00410 [candidate division WOR-3 bacterium]|nr:hypothetical protein [candidate division WOR-3 bacterium]
MKKNTDKKVKKQEITTVGVQGIVTMPESLSSIELTQTANDTRVKVKVYHANPEEGMKKAQQLYDAAIKKYGSA